MESYYDSHNQDEWTRLVRDPYRSIEFEVTKHYLKRYLPKQGLILDLGGGPGRYTIHLAKQGYHVVLADISQQSLLLAEENIRKARMNSREGLSSKPTQRISTCWRTQRSTEHWRSAPSII